MYIPIILGTARKGRQSEKVANFVLAETKKKNLDSEILDVRDYRIEATDNTEEIPQAEKLSKKIKKADAIIIVSINSVTGYQCVADSLYALGEIIVDKITPSLGKIR